MNWKPGDKAELVRFEGDRPHAELIPLIGHHCELVARVFFIDGEYLDWQIRVAASPVLLLVSEWHLRPIPAAHETSSWEAVREICDWTPGEVVKDGCETP